MPNNALAGSFNSKEYAWKDMTFAMFGGTIVGIQELTYDKEVDQEEIYGQGDEALAINNKNKKYSGQLTLLMSEFEKMNDAAIAAGYDDVIDLPASPINCDYSKDGVNVKSKVLKGCKFGKYSGGGKQGDGFLPVMLPFKFTGIKHK